MGNIKSNAIYQLGNGLSIEGSVINAAILSGLRTYQRELHTFKGIDDLESRLKGTIQTVLDAVQGNHESKCEILEKLKLYILKQILEG